ncbi:MAG: inorganic diphosphatase [Candidatus Margulisiibacteriota bacterium]
MMNPWHDLNPGKKSPEIVTAVIEIPRGSRGKFELDKDSGLIKLDRVLFSTSYYPANYGFIPKSYCEDKDPLDILVICSVDLPSGSMADARVIGGLDMIDGGEEDTKILAVANDDVTLKHITDLEQLPPHLITEIHDFFVTYKRLEKKAVEIKGVFGRAKAIEAVKAGLDLYTKTF